MKQLANSTQLLLCILKFIFHFSSKFKKAYTYFRKKKLRLKRLLYDSINIKITTDKNLNLNLRFEIKQFSNSIVNLL